MTGGINLLYIVVIEEGVHVTGEKDINLYTCNDAYVSSLFSLLPSSSSFFFFFFLLLFVSLNVYFPFSCL